MKQTTKKTLNGASVQISPGRKKTRQGNGLNSKPRGTRKLKVGQGG